MDERAALLAEIEAEVRDTARWTGRAQLSPKVAAALAKVRRSAFVPSAATSAAYENRPLPIGHDQTISQPYIVAIMTELLDLQPDDKVLEVGTGSGYQAAVLAELAGTVCSIEVIPQLAERAAAALAAEGYTRIMLRTGDGGRGWPEEAPFDAILVAASGPDVPAALRQQLAVGGRLVMPVGESRRLQMLRRIRRRTETDYEEEDLGSVTFVPLIGEQGWSEDA
jgi:protein-L-isoaspartate(D-aspartate) O-methyltransferase